MDTDEFEQLRRETLASLERWAGSVYAHYHAMLEALLRCDSAELYRASFINDPQEYWFTNHLSEPVEGEQAAAARAILEDDDAEWPGWRVSSMCRGATPTSAAEINLPWPAAKPSSPELEKAREVLRAAAADGLEEVGISFDVPVAVQIYESEITAVTVQPELAVPASWDADEDEVSREVADAALVVADHAAWPHWDTSM